MIVPMEKLTVLIFHKAKELFLSSLQDLGVVHIALEQKETSAQLLKNITGMIERSRLFILAAKKFSKQKTISLAGSQSLSGDFNIQRDIFSYVQSYESTKEEISALDERIDKTERQIRNLIPWGDFDIESVKKMKDIGINVRFFIIPVKKFNACRIEDLVYEEIYRDRTYIYFVVFERGEKTDIDCDEFFYPETDLGSLEKEKDDFRSLRQEKIKILRSFFNRLDEVEEYCSQLESEYAFLNVSANLNNAVEGTVNIINGWVPSSAKNRIEKFLQEQNAYFYFAKPQAGEPVPILLKNNWFSRLFEPITKMFSLPHYAELDLTAFFAPFFTLFFGLCLGDAGYGLLIFFAALFAHFKLSEDKKPIAKLIMILGVSTCIFGVLTGTFFGIPLVEIEIFRKIVLLDQTRIFYGALILGVIQIIYGMCIKALNRIRMYGFMSSLSTFGWIFLVAGLTRLVAGTIAELPKAQWAVLCLYFGVVLILLFNDLKANIFIRIGKGLWELYGITGVFGDVLSYIRLFALGVSSAILGLVFNDIAFQCKTIPVIGFFVTFMLLVILHGINLALSALSSFVHPLRLTFVEFYKSAGFEGGGKAYDPFRQIKVK